MRARAAAMTTPDLRSLVNLAGDVLGVWGETQALTRELVPFVQMRQKYAENLAGTRQAC